MSYTIKGYLLDISKKVRENCTKIIVQTRVNFAGREKFMIQLCDSKVEK